jgi:hypothetical protein
MKKDEDIEELCFMEGNKSLIQEGRGLYTALQMTSELDLWTAKLPWPIMMGVNLCTYTAP